MWQTLCSVPLLASSSDLVTLGPALTQIGVGSLIAAPAFATTWQLWKRLDKEREEVRLLQLARVQDAKDAVLRERELADRLGPLLANAAEVLSTAPARFDQALNQVQTASRSSEVDQLMQRLETTVRNIAQDRR